VAAILCIMLLASAVGAPARAAQGIAGYSVMAWTTKDGVYPGPFRAVTQDRDGYIWLGISVDLVRFDGVRFTTWSELSEDPLRNGGVVTVLTAGRDGSLWVGHSPGGVTRIRDGVTTSFAESSDVPAGRVLGIVEDRDGIMWLATRTGLARFTDGQWERVSLHEHAIDEVLYGLFRDRSGRLLVSTATGVFRRSDTTPWFEQLSTARGVVGLSEDTDGVLWAADDVAGFRRLGDGDETAHHGLAERGQPRPSLVGVRVMHDRAGNLWVATQGKGLLRVPRNGASVEQMTKADGLTSNAVLSLFEDRQGNVWAGTENGLVRLRETRGISTVDLSFSGGHSVTSTRDGSVWVGTTEGLYRFWNEGRRRYSAEDGLPADEIVALPAENQGPLIVATARGIVQLRDGKFRAVPLPEGITGTDIDAIASDVAGDLWLCHTTRGPLRVTGSNVSGPLDVPGVTGKGCLSLLAEPGGRVWIGFKDGSVAVLAQGIFTLYSRNDGLPGGSVASIYRDDRGVVWICTTKGLAIFDRDHFVVTARGGFPTGGVSAALEDDAGDMWLGFVSGVVHLIRADVEQLLRNDRARLNYDLYDASDGMGGLPLFRGFPAAARGVDGRLWFVTATGVATLEPAALRTPRPAPPVQVETVTVNGRVRQPTPDLALPPLTSELRIDYTALSFASPMKTRFRYRLRGFDRDWVDVGTRRQAIYANLLPGRYEFSVLANDGGHEWSEAGIDWAFTVRPRLYQTSWFWLLWLALASLGLYAAWRWRLQRVEAQFTAVATERSRLAREIHDTLLQSLVGLTLRFDIIAQRLDRSPEAAKALLARLRDDVQGYIREARESIWDMRSSALISRTLVDALRDTCDSANEYHLARCEFRVTGQYHPSNMRLEEHILRIAREAVMNALRHAEATRIAVTLDCADSAMRLGIADDGRGFDPDGLRRLNGDHWGLVDMLERARLSGGCVTVQSRPGEGTRVEAVFPLTRASA